jgi:membrane protein YqaA with SNARE-associated domain
VIEPLPLPPQPEKDAIPHPALTRNPLKRLYGWVLSWAHHPAGTWALAAIAFIDSSVFPIPGLFLQIALSMERPKRSWWYALVNTVASVAGAVVGYGIGYALWESVGIHVIGPDGPKAVAAKLKEFGIFPFLMIYSFIPFPYKIATIGSGVLHDTVPLWVLLVASTIGRSLRFFLLASLTYFKGRAVKEFIDRYFNLVTLAVALLVAGVLVVLKLASKTG